jgi:single-strand DNA-binding protein
MNTVILLGNLTRDVELKQTASGSSVANFSLAMNERYKDSAGNWQEKPVFVEIVAWGNRGEAIAKYFHKGSKILINGRLQLDQWENEAGEKRSKLRVVLDGFDFVTPKDTGSPTAVPSQAYVESPPADQSSADAGWADEDSDIPF